MKIFTVSFDVDQTLFWSRMRRVFSASVREHMPGVEIIEHIIDKPAYQLGKAVNLTYNTEKLRIWNEYQQQSTDDTIFMDVDMLCLGDARPAFEEVEHVGITTHRPGMTPPLNAGVVFARPTEEARFFFNSWLAVNNEMYKDSAFHNKWAEKYLGMNQAALGAIIENNLSAWATPLDAVRYNATDPCWHLIDKDTVFVHLKGQLRTALLNNVAPQPPVASVMRRWYELDTRVNGIEHNEQINKPISARTAKGRGRA